MAKFIDVIVTIDGFQHGEDEFTLKAMAVVASAVSFQWSNLYHTAFLADRQWGHLQTYRTQVHHHGHAIRTPGAAQYTAPDHLCWALCQVQLAYMKKKTSPVPTSPDLDKGPPKLVFCRDSPTAIRARNSEPGRHRMPSHPEAANQTRRPYDSGNVIKGPAPGCSGRGPLYSRTVVGCDIFFNYFIFVHNHEWFSIFFSSFFPSTGKFRFKGAGM